MGRAAIARSYAAPFPSLPTLNGLDSPALTYKLSVYANASPHPGPPTPHPAPPRPTLHVRAPSVRRTISSRSAPPPAEDSLMAGRDTSVMELTWSEGGAKKLLKT